MWTLDAKVTGFEIGLPDCVRTLFVPSGSEGLSWPLRLIIAVVVMNICLKLMKGTL